MAAGAHAQVHVGTRDGELLEEHPGHVVVIVLPRVDQVLSKTQCATQFAT